MPNIKFNYLYRDGGNYKKYGCVIFANPTNVNVSEFEKLIRSRLIDSTWFYVNEWRLPDLHFDTWDNEIDHTWHEFESVEYSDELVDVSFSLNIFIELIEKTDWYIKQVINNKFQRFLIGESIANFERLAEKAKDFADELTIHNAIEKNLNKRAQMAQEYEENNKAVQDILLRRVVNPDRDTNEESS